ncbi:MAG: uroporphyrinogen-III C-methyltransferase [Corynebacterium sp.]|nr:uroporphyrinogen-III C-methyltransferase [Corynebacterium sp.]
MNYQISLIGGGPGAWDLITLRGLDRLRAADVIIADHLGPTQALDKLLDAEKLASVELIDASKLPYGRQMAQERINELMIEKAKAGLKVARLKGGDPYVFGRGFEEMEALTKEGLSVEVIPGVTSAISVPEIDGVAVTVRGVVHNFTVISGHLPPGHPQSLNNWEALAKTNGTLVVIMGVKNGGAIAEALISHGLTESTPVAIIQEGTTKGQRSFRCDLAGLGKTIEQEEIKPPAVIVIGKVAGL